MNESDRNEVREEPRVMSKGDVDDYHGLTLNEQGEQEQSKTSDSFVHVHTVRINELPWWKKVLGVFGIAAFVLLGLVLVWFFFIYGAVVFAVGAVIYLLRKYLLK